MLSGEKIQLFETKRLTRDGRVLDVQISSTIYLNRNAEPVGNIVTLRDISAQKKAEIELRKYHDHLEEYCDHLERLPHQYRRHTGTRRLRW